MLLCSEIMAVFSSSFLKLCPVLLSLPVPKACWVLPVGTCITAASVTATVLPSSRGLSLTERRRLAQKADPATRLGDHMQRQHIHRWRRSSCVHIKRYQHPKYTTTAGSKGIFSFLGQSTDSKVWSVRRACACPSAPSSEALVALLVISDATRNAESWQALGIFLTSQKRARKGITKRAKKDGTIEKSSSDEAGSLSSGLAPWPWWLRMVQMSRKTLLHLIFTMHQKKLILI